MKLKWVRLSEIIFRFNEAALHEGRKSEYDPVNKPVGGTGFNEAALHEGRKY